MPHWYHKFLDEFDKERNTKAFYQTQGFKKLWNYYIGVVESDRFQLEVRGLRDKYEQKMGQVPFSIPYSPLFVRLKRSYGKKSRFDYRTD